MEQYAHPDHARAVCLIEHQRFVYVCSCANRNFIMKDSSGITHGVQSTKNYIH